MKTKLLIGMLLLAAALAPAQTNNLAALLQQGLLEEQANRNLEAAITDYQALAAQFDHDRPMAATAVFRLGECYRAGGRTNEAAGQYQRILREFSDQPTLAMMSRQNLAGMGVPLDVPAAAASEPQKELLAKQIALAEQEQNLADTQRLVQAGKGSASDVRAAERELLRLQQQLAALQADKAAAAESEEDKEIHRIQQLVQNSPDLINAPSSGSTPLVSAAYYGQLKVAAYLLDHGADVNVGAPDARFAQELAYAGPLPPLLAAVATGNKAMTQFLIDRGANVNFDGWKDGNTPLHLAAQKGFQAVVEVLLASHADVNARNKTGATPLFCAVWNRQLKIIPMLLAAGADANLKDNGGLTAMTSAVGRSPELVQALLAGGANSNAEDKDGRTLLSYAVDRGGARSSAAMLKLLLAAKADPNGGKVDAPLLTAIRQADLAAAELLLQAGASPNAKGPVNWEVVIDGRNYSGDSKPAISPMYYAVQAQLPMVQLLLKFKGDPNDSQTDGKALLFSALDKPEIVRALLDAGANANATKGTDNQPDLCISLLQWAAFKNYSNSVDLLLQHGANPDACNALGNSALHSAADSLADETVFAALLDHQANPNVRNHNGKTPLDLLQAALNDHNSFPVRLPSVAAKEALVHRLIDLMHQRGALDNLPDWDRITLGRPANNYSAMVFQKSTNDWNHFTLLEMLYWTEARASRSTYWAQAAFPDLAHITVIRPGRDGTTHQRIPVNLLDGATNVAVARDMALEFGDVVEVPEREHSLAEATTYLTYGQELAILNHLRDQAGEATLVVAGGPAVKLRLQPFFSQIGDVLAQDKAALAALTSNSDLAHVQVTRRNPETNKTDEWTVDCTHPASWPLDLWLRAGDVIAVPLKP